jgi:hypothetical protein
LDDRGSGDRIRRSAGRRRTIEREEVDVRVASIGRVVALGIGIGLSVTAAVAQQAKMYGSVVDDQGQPVANAKVIMEPTEKGSRVEVVTKGKKGSYLIGILRAGTYNLKVDAPGMVLVSIKAKATEKDKKEPIWTRDGKVRADQPPQLQVDDGMEIVCDVVVGHGAEVANGSGGTTVATPDQAIVLLTQQIAPARCRSSRSSSPTTRRWGGPITSPDIAMRSSSMTTPR